MKLLTEIFVAFILFGAYPALGCKCALPGPTVEESFQNSDIIFVGQCSAGEVIISKQGLTEYPSGTTYKFKVQKVIKGTNLQDAINVHTGIGFGDCGYEFRLGMSYLVYGYRKNGRIETNICARTKAVGFYPLRIIQESEKEIEDLLSIVIFNNGTTNHSSGSPTAPAEFNRWAM